jgi:cation-transporting ATPase E
MPSVVAEGRRVINNIQRSASLFLVKNIFSFLLALISVFASFAYPMAPIQLSLISTLTIGLPGFFLAMENNHERVQGSFMKNVLFQAFPVALTDVVVIMGAILFGKAFSIPQTMISTISVALMALVGFAMLYRICRPFTWQRGLLVAGLMLAFLLAVILVPDFFALTSPDFGGWMVLTVLALLIPSLVWSFCRMLDWLSLRYRSCKEWATKKFRR